ncbi:MAG: 4-alpha-glucanotransferase [Acidobacteria bacterium RIFCSPLOWO2_12_FULL_65_11]|nr:MAG: 4-alpha-glucanotransferase [Acidobacteria bacterium RIFCSPLOWO2_12_FULL_65_11]
MTDAALCRRAGLLIPLFSFPSSTSWGIGDIGDLVPMTAWLAAAGQRVLQILPINEMAPGQQSPYSAISAMAIDPIFLRLPDVPEFAAMGGEASLGSGDRELLGRVRRAPRIEYASVWRLKHASLRVAFEWFWNTEWRRDTARARAFRSFVSEQAWWVEDYALFRAIHAREGERPWTEWPAALARREPADIDRTRRELATEVLFYQYLQWLAMSQWREARRQAHEVAIFGDLPFMVDGDSADVWARQQQFRLDVSIGAPPDAFSAAGQNWGMPLYRWDVMAVGDFLWLRERARRAADLYDGYRIDHLVGFYRTFAWPTDGSPPFFTPADEPTQTALGERLLGIFRATGSTIVAEDLGVVPDFVRASLARLGVSGFRVFRWERRWGMAGQPFIDPVEYPPTSVATSGTHDTEPLACWWEHLSADERRKVGEVPAIQRLTGSNDAASDAPFNPTIRDALVAALFASGSNLLMLPIQDVFGTSERINEPATVNDVNWTYRLPWPSDRLDEIPEACERREALRRWAATYHRL